MVVRAQDPRLRVRLGEQDGRGPVPAADVGHPAAGGELALDILQRGDPGGGEVGDVARAEEQLTAREHVLVVLVPAHAGAGAERVSDLRFGSQRAQREHERPGQVQRPVRVGQREGLLFGQRELTRGGVVADVPSRGLPGQPLRDIPRVGLGAPCQLLRGRRVFGEAAVQPEPVPHDHAAGRDSGAEVGDERAEELVQLVLVDAHFALLIGDGAAASLRGRRLRLRQRSVKSGKAQIRAADIQ